MSNMGTATRQMKKNQTEELMEAIAQQIDFNSMAIGKLSLRAECMIQLLLNKGIITTEEYEAEIKKAVEQISKAREGQTEEDSKEETEETTTE